MAAWRHREAESDVHMIFHSRCSGVNTVVPSTTAVQCHSDQMESCADSLLVASLVTLGCAK